MNLERGYTAAMHIIYITLTYNIMESITGNETELQGKDEGNTSDISGTTRTRPCRRR